MNLKSVTHPDWRCSGCGQPVMILYRHTLPGPGFCRPCWDAAKR